MSMHHHADLNKIANPDDSTEVLTESIDMRKRKRHLEMLTHLANHLRLESTDIDTRRKCESTLRAIGALTESVEDD
jgi:hypothetical protein